MSNPSTTTTLPSLRDRARRSWYLTRFSWHMQDYPGRAYRQVRADLRREIDAAAGAVGMPAALRDVGHPAVLAQGYLGELGTHRPRYTSGAVAAGLVVGAVLWFGAAYALGTLDTLETLGGGTLTRHPFGGEVVFTSTGAEISVLAEPTWAGTAVLVGLAALAFALASRIWRVWRRADAGRD